MRAAAAIASLALLAGCVRSVRVEPGGGKPVDTGVPVAFSVEGAGAGADVDVEWTFGDGARVEHGARVAHAFDRAGRYQVVARSLGRVVGGAAVDVQPRPVLRAVPAAAQAALYCPAPRGRLDDAADFLDGMLGPGGASDLLDRTGVVRLALQSAAAGEGAVDPDEGLAFFTLPGVSGAVAAVGVVDGDAALGVLGQSLEEQGAGLSQSAGGYVRVHRPGRVDAGAFLDRGYLYLALPERDAQVEEQLQRVVGLVAAAGAGAEAWPLIRELEGSVPRGLCALALPGRPGAVVRGLYASLQVAGKELHVEGVLRAGQPLWTAPAAAPSLLESGPDGPAAAVSISAPPEVLASLLLGAGGSPERRRSEEALRGDGWDVKGALGGLGEEVVAAAYFDAPAFLANLIRGTREPDPRGALWVDARLRRKEPALHALREALEARGLEYAPGEAGAGAEAIRFRALGHPVEVTLGKDRLRLRAGTVAGWRRTVPLREALAARVGPGAFGAGHVSALVDLEEVRTELMAHATVAGVSDERVQDVQRFALRFINQLTGVGELAVDMAPDPLGARLRARVTVGEGR